MKTVLAIVVFCVAIATTYGLKCYVCEGVDSFVDKTECGDNFEKDDHKDLLETCNATAGEVWCRKQKSGVNEVLTNIHRACAAQCEDDKGAHLDRVDCCQGDGCNAGSNTTPALVLLLTSALCTAVKILA